MLYSFDTQQFKTPGTQTDSEPADEVLLERVAKEDEAALRILHDRHHRLLLSIIGQVTHESADADEVFQDVMVDIWKHAGNFSREKGHAMGWIVTLARRRAIDRVRRSKTYSSAKDRYQESTKHEMNHMDDHSVENDACSSDLLHVISQIMDELPPAQKQAVFFTMFKGLTQREIARETRTPLGTIKTRIELGLRKIRSAMIARGSKQEWMANLEAA